MFLFVEDNGMDVAMAASLLTRLGVRDSRVVDTAGKAMDFLEQVESGEVSAPEAVIIDLLLRAGSGQDVMRFMRGREGLKQIPVLVWTVVADELTHRICMTMGAREVLVKSRRAQELREALLRLRGLPPMSA
ncbi:MAG TPA: response regulator [Terracidiphilus sp.]